MDDVRRMDIRTGGRLMQSLFAADVVCAVGQFALGFRMRKLSLYSSRLHEQAGEHQNHPPRFAQFALLLIPKRNRENLIGDLEEEYRTIVLPQYGHFLARCWYVEQVAIAIACYAWPTIKKILGLSFILKLIGR